MDEISQPQKTENKQMEIRDGGDEGEEEMNGKSAHAPNDQTEGTFIFDRSMMQV